MTAGRRHEPESVKSSSKWTVGPCDASSWSCGVSDLGLTEVWNAFVPAQDDDDVPGKENRNPTKTVTEIDKCDATEAHEVTLRQHEERALLFHKSNKKMGASENGSRCLETVTKIINARSVTQKAMTEACEAKLKQEENTQDSELTSEEQKRLTKQQDFEKRMQKAREQQKKLLMKKEAAEKQKRLEEEQRRQQSSKKHNIPRPQENSRANKQKFVSQRQQDRMKVKSEAWKAEQAAIASAQRQEWERNWHAKQQQQQRQNQQFYSAGGVPVPPPMQTASPPTHQPVAAATHQWHRHPQQQNQYVFAKQAPPPLHTTAPVQQVSSYRQGQNPIPQQSMAAPPVNPGVKHVKDFDPLQQQDAAPRGAPFTTAPPRGAPPADQYHKPSQYKTNASAGARPSPAQQPKPTPPHKPAPPDACRYANASNGHTGPQDTTAIIKRNILTSWALQPAMLQTLRPIDELVTTLHKVIPPAFGVASHDYFTQWKPIARQSLVVNKRCNDEKLKKAVRKIRFFLHPDKLPKDLTESQSFVCAMLWDIISDAWENHQAKGQ